MSLLYKFIDFSSVYGYSVAIAALGNQYNKEKMTVVDHTVDYFIDAVDSCSNHSSLLDCKC
jgi:hypothetical protein